VSDFISTGTPELKYDGQPHIVPGDFKCPVPKQQRLKGWPELKYIISSYYYLEPG
jgi:hypothetical protein